MKLHIDTMDNDELKCEIDTLIPYDLGICIGTVLDYFAKKHNQDAVNLKIKVGAEIVSGILDSVNQEVIEKFVRRGK